MRNTNNGGVLVYDIRNNQIIGNNNVNNGALLVYDIDSNQVTGNAFMGVVGLDWKVAFGNFSSRPGVTDMIMRNTNTGGMVIYDINNNQVTSAYFIGAVGLDWQFAGVAPVRTAGESDLVLRNVNTGAFQVYDIAFNALIGSASLGAVGLDWQLGGLAVDPPVAAGGAMDASDDSTAQLVQAIAGFNGDSGAQQGHESSARRGSVAAATVFDGPTARMRADTDSRASAANAASQCCFEGIAASPLGA